MPYPMKKKEKQMGNITETGHFEKLAELESRLEEIDTDIDIQWALRCIEDDHLEGWDGTEEEKQRCIISASYLNTISGGSFP